MIPVDLLFFALGTGVGLCAGWMLGAIAGHRTARKVQVTRTQSVFLPTDYEDDIGDCTMPPGLSVGCSDPEQRIRDEYARVPGLATRPGQIGY